MCLLYSRKLAWAYVQCGQLSPGVGIYEVKHGFVLCRPELQQTQRARLRWGHRPGAVHHAQVVRGPGAIGELCAQTRSESWDSVADLVSLWKSEKDPSVGGEEGLGGSTDVNHPDVTNDSQSLRGQDSWRSDLNSYSCGALFRGHDLDTFPRNFMLYINKEVMHRKN